MREMKYSGIPSIGDVPSHWDISRIKTLLSLRSEKNSGDRELLSVYLDRGVISYRNTEADHHSVVRSPEHQGSA